MVVPVGKLMGVPTLVMALSKISAMGLDKATDPLSPTTKSLYAFLSALTILLTSLMRPELTPPQRPLSEVTGTRSHFFGVMVCFFLLR